ncbi:MAG: glycosyltransferase [Pseudomonadota bacterium]
MAVVHDGMAALKTLLFKIWLLFFRHIGARFMPKRASIPGAPAIRILGFHNSILGIGETARLFLSALKAGGRQAGALTLDHRLVLAETGANTHCDLVISHLNPPELEVFSMRRAPRRLLKAAHIGYWVWELERIPPFWRDERRLVDAIWTPSHFSADAIRAGLGEANVVHVIEPPIFAARSEPFDRSRLDAPDDALLALAVCDLRSTAARKNPYGAITAFMRAADRQAGRAHLIVKVVGAQAEPSAFARLTAAVDARSDISLYAASLSDTEMIGLISVCDIAISLHRSEGFGLLAAHAAYAGRAVVSTNWAAPMEFLTTEGAELIRYRRVPVYDPQGLYPSGFEWAEPDLDQAADAIERLISDQTYRQRLGEAAGESARNRFSATRWLARFDDLVDRAREASG